MVRIKGCQPRRFRQHRVVSSGLLIATFLTLVVVPTLYFLLERSKEGLTEGVRQWERVKMRAYQVLVGE